MAWCYCEVDENGRIMEARKIEFGVPSSEFFYDFPSDFDFNRLHDYRLVQGELQEDREES